MEQAQLVNYHLIFQGHNKDTSGVILMKVFWNIYLRQKKLVPCGNNSGKPSDAASKVLCGTSMLKNKLYGQNFSLYTFFLS